MEKLKAALVIAGLSAGLGFADSAAAQSNPGSWYLGGTLGQSKFKEEGDQQRHHLWRGPAIRPHPPGRGER